MYKEAKCMFMVCESPLHVGSGSELDYIDMPIQRERHTQFPKIESSSLRGAIRERFYSSMSKIEANDPEAKVKFSAAFGAEQKEQIPGKERQGCLTMSDARLLLFPVKSMKGVFGWITCPFVLARFENDLIKLDPTLEISGNYSPERGSAIVFHNSDLILEKESASHIFLEEYSFDAKKMNPDDIKIGKEPLSKWLSSALYGGTNLSHWKSHLEKNFVIVSNDDFTDFVELSTEVITRNRIDVRTGTVAPGALFTEEYLPTDSVLYSLVMTHNEFDKSGKGLQAADMMNFFSSNINGTFNNSFQVGGNATTGKGLIRSVLS